MHNRTSKVKDKVTVSQIFLEVWAYLAVVVWVSQVVKAIIQEWVARVMVELRNTISKIPDRRRVKDVNKRIP